MISSRPSRESEGDFLELKSLNKEMHMNPSTKDQIEGALHEVKGKVKETAGQVLNNPDLESDGQAENLGGKLQKKLGQIEKVFEK